MPADTVRPAPRQLVSGVANKLLPALGGSDDDHGSPATRGLSRGVGGDPWARGNKSDVQIRPRPWTPEQESICRRRGRNKCRLRPFLIAPAGRIDWRQYANSPLELAIVPTRLTLVQHALKDELQVCGVDR